MRMPVSVLCRAQDRTVNNDESLKLAAMHSRVRASANDAHVNAQCAAIYRNWVGPGIADRSVFSTSLRSTESTTKQSMLTANW